MWLCIITFVGLNAKSDFIRYPDIQHYVSSNLSENLGFAALQRGHTELASSLIKKVSKKASGVFLWVVLVVSMLY